MVAGAVAFLGWAGRFGVHGRGSFLRWSKGYSRALSMGSSMRSMTSSKNPNQYPASSTYPPKPPSHPIPSYNNSDTSSPHPATQFSPVPTFESSASNDPIQNLCPPLAENNLDDRLRNMGAHRLADVFWRWVRSFR